MGTRTSSGLLQDLATNPAEIKRRTRRLAREYHPGRQQGKRQARRSASRRSPRPTTSSVAPRSARSTTRPAAFGNGGFRPGPGGAAAAAPSTSIWATSRRRPGRGQAGAGLRRAGSATSSGPVQPHRRRRPRHRHADPAAAWPGHRVRGHPELHGGHRGRDGPVAHVLAGTPARPVRAPATRTATPRVCPTCVGTGQVARGSGGGFSLTDPCPDCKGRGLIAEDPCDICKGSGRAKSSRTMQVRIPAGVSDGQRIRLRGRAHAVSGAVRRATCTW